jgi:hypothetical protein
VIVLSHGGSRMRQKFLAGIPTSEVAYIQSRRSLSRDLGCNGQLVEHCFVLKLYCSQVVLFLRSVVCHRVSFLDAMLRNDCS